MVHARGAGSIAGDMLPFQQGQALYTTDCRRVVCAVGRISAAADDAGFFFAKHYAKMDPPCSVRTGKREGLVGGGASSGERNFIREI